MEEYESSENKDTTKENNDRKNSNTKEFYAEKNFWNDRFEK
jgi:hypothetical protein